MGKFETKVKYLLITVEHNAHDCEIYSEQFDTHQDAHEQMMREIKEQVGKHLPCSAPNRIWERIVSRYNTSADEDEDRAYEFAREAFGFGWWSGYFRPTLLHSTGDKTDWRITPVSFVDNKKEEK